MNEVRPDPYLSRVTTGGQQIAVSYIRGSMTAVPRSDSRLACR
jgi:hypothetical protein